MTKKPRHKREMLFMETMKHRGIDLVYEPARFKLPGLLKSYTPDFYYPSGKLYIELAGTRSSFSNGRRKYAAFKEEYPHLKFVVLEKRCNGNGYIELSVRKVSESKFARPFKKKRKSRGLSREACAVKLGVSFSSVVRWESGLSVPRTRLIKDKIAAL